MRFSTEAIVRPGLRPFQEWNARDGKPSAQFFRLPGEFLVRFPALAEFRLAEDGGTVDCFPVPGAGDRWRGLFQQQILPLLQSLKGDPVYHGAGIRIGRGSVALLGPSGRGKSTLAAAFARLGYPFLGDDCLRLRLDPDGCAEILPDQRSIRLWDDSLDALAPDGARTSHVPGSYKQQLLATSGLPYCDEPMPLTCAYQLAEGHADSVCLTPLRGAKAVMAWTANAFVLDIKSPKILRRNIETATRLARLAPVSVLDYPREYGVLDAVVASIVADVDSLSES